MALSVTAVRRATPDDLAYIQDIEAAADQLFADLMDISGWDPPAPGAEREGTLLVIGQPPVGFAQIIEVDGGHHLHALAVVPTAQNRGLGTSLMQAAFGVVADAGGHALTLTTYTDVPWNGPWYRRLGFTELRDLTPGLAALREAERAAGLDAGGRRAVMTRTVTAAPAPIPAVSVLPVRDGAHGMETFVQHRTATMDFVPGAVVFPGGRVDPGDDQLGCEVDLPAERLAQHVVAWSATDQTRFGEGAAGARTTIVTGLRELAEEAGIRADAAALIPWDNWITPLGHPKRFDVRYFVLPVTDPAMAARFRNTTTEARFSEWTSVAELEARAENRSLLLVPPTRVLVEELATFPTVAQISRMRPRIVPVHHDLCALPGARPGRDRTVDT